MSIASAIIHRRHLQVDRVAGTIIFQSRRMLVEELVGVWGHRLIAFKPESFIVRRDHLFSVEFVSLSFIRLAPRGRGG